MYNLLVVDDEKIIREGIYELFLMEDSLELNLFMAASAIEAQAILEERKIDIVLTDIKMPKVSGIELMEIILERWPHCKIIFLTGYSEFDYVYKVHKHARYVLKAEDDSKIIDAIKEAIDEIESDFTIEQITKNSSVLKRQQEEQERTTFLTDLIDGYASVDTLTQDVIKLLGISIDINKEIYYLVIRHEHMESSLYEERLIISKNIQILINKYFFDTMKGTYVNYNKNFIFLLLQPTKLITGERSARAIQGTCELFQKACMKNLNMSVSIIIGAKSLTIKEVFGKFYRLKALLLMKPEDNVLLIDEKIDVCDFDDGGFQKQQIHSKIPLIDYYFENSNREMLIALIDEVTNFLKDTQSMHDLFAVEIYCSIASKLLSYINQFDLSQEMCFKISVVKLFNVNLHQDWKEAFSYLRDITHFIFDLKMVSMEKTAEDVVKRVKRYIKENLDKDTSLDTLADLVNLSPEYLLRVFKKNEQITILQYINDMKIIKAKKLIVNNDMQIKEIADSLGFTSAGYFGRFFKKHTGMTPQVYRDHVGKLTINSFNIT